MKTALILTLVGTSGLVPHCWAAQDKATGISFMREYIRELSEFNQIRVAADKEMKTDSNDERIGVMINCSEKFQLQLREAVQNLKRFRFTENSLDQLVPQIIKFYGMKIELWRQMSDLASQFLAPREGVDYGELAAEMPKIRARMEYIDQALIKSSPLIFMVLIDFSQKDQSKPAHLAITKAERDDLVESLRNDFGSNLDQQGQNYEVSTAGLLQTFLLRNKCADEVSYK